jgi:Protein of unknown function (DUF1236)
MRRCGPFNRRGLEQRQFPGKTLRQNAIRLVNGRNQPGGVSLCLKARRLMREGSSSLRVRLNGVMSASGASDRGSIDAIAHLRNKQEVTMKSYFGCATAILVLASATAASAQTTVIERDSPAVITRERVELTPAQRTTIYRTVTRERVRAAEPSFAVRLGARVPQAVELQEIPTAVVEEVPSVRRYRYMVVNNEVVLVDPTTSEVIEIIRQ